VILFGDRHTPRQFNELMTMGRAFSAHNIASVSDGYTHKKNNISFKWILTKVTLKIIVLI